MPLITDAKHAERNIFLQLVSGTRDHSRQLWWRTTASNAPRHTEAMLTTKRICIGKINNSINSCLYLESPAFPSVYLCEANIRSAS